MSPEKLVYMANQIGSFFRHRPEAEWEQGRLSFLRRLAMAPGLYRSPPIVAAFAAQARRNIARELGRV